MKASNVSIPGFLWQEPRPLIVISEKSVKEKYPSYSNKKKTTTDLELPPGRGHDSKEAILK